MKNSAIDDTEEARTDEVSMKLIEAKNIKVLKSEFQSKLDLGTVSALYWTSFFSHRWLIHFTIFFFN